jgi:uncharacterized protein (TIRG00374 family)
LKVNKRTVFNLLKYLLAFGLLSYVIHSNWSPASGKGLGYVWERYVVEGRPLQTSYLLAALLTFAAALFLTYIRWYVLVRAQSLPFTLAEALRFGLLGYFFNTFLPGSVGGDIIKAAALARVQSRRTVAVTTVLMDRVIALWGLFWFVALTGGAFWAAGTLEGSAGVQAKLVVSTASLLVVVSAGAWLLMGLLDQRRAECLTAWLSRLPRVGGPAAEFCRAVWLYRCRQSSVMLALLLSWLGFVCFSTCFYCCAHALWDGDPARSVPGLAEHFLLVPVGLIIMAVPLFPGGAGIGELGFGLLYGWFGYDRAAGILGSLVQRVLSWVLALGSYGVYLWTNPSARVEGGPDAGVEVRESLVRAGHGLAPAGQVRSG